MARQLMHRFQRRIDAGFQLFMDGFEFFDARFGRFDPLQKRSGGGRGLG